MFNAQLRTKAIAELAELTGYSAEELNHAYDFGIDNYGSLVRYAVDERILNRMNDRAFLWTMKNVPGAAERLGIDSPAWSNAVTEDQ